MKKLRFFSLVNMRRVFAATTLLSIMPSIGVAETGESTRILLLGDSSVIVSYLPEEQRPQAVLGHMLTALKPGSKIQVINAADNGEFIGRYLISGAYERLRTSLPGADVIVIRFGANDEKRISPEEYGRQLEHLVDLLTKDFPSAKIVLETGVYMDPKHYTFDRNKTLIAYWEKAKAIAAARNFPCSDVYAAMERETLAGNWDLRLRKSNTPIKATDPGKDRGKENDMAWFSNIHPNDEGVRVACQELASCIATAFPDKLPTGALKTERAPLDKEYYSTLLSFTSDRMAEVKAPPWRTAARKKTSTPMDDLQTPLNPLNKTKQP